MDIYYNCFPKLNEHAIGIEMNEQCSDWKQLISTELRQLFID